MIMDAGTGQKNMLEAVEREISDCRRGSVKDADLRKMNVNLDAAKVTEFEKQIALQERALKGRKHVQSFRIILFCITFWGEICS